MSAFKTYKGDRLDLDHYRAKTINDFEILVYEDDGTDKDLSVYDDIKIEVFEKIHGTQVLSFDFQSGVSTDSPAGNSIYWYATYSQTNIRPKFYWHECWGSIGSGVKRELIFQGVSTVI